MVYKITISFLLVLCFSYALANKRDNCHCSIVLKEIILDIENNYPGYQEKLKVYNEREYQKLKAKAIKQASTNADREKCFYIIEGYIRFFKDNHIIFTDRNTEPKQVLIEKKSFKDTSDQLTGIWRKNDLMVKIVKESDEGTLSTYKAYIVEPTNKIGNIHFELIGNEHEFRVRKYNRSLTTDLLRGRKLRNLLIEPDGIWKKIAYKTDDLPNEKLLYSNNSKFTSKPINDNIYYLGIPEFTIDAKEFDSIIVNKVIPQVNVNKVENLIIDLRNNVGGNSSFLSLMRLVYENPFSIPGDFLYSTEDLIKKYRISTSPYYQSMLPKLLANIGNFVQRDSLKIALKESYQYPTTISIIVNENSASSSEYFLKLAKHSTKVRVYGRHTAGTLDYSELFKPEKLSCPDYSFMRPTTKSYWTDTNPIDNTGIKPDVDLSYYPDNEWINIIVDKYINK